MVKICFTANYFTSKRIVLQKVPDPDCLMLLSLNSHFESPFSRNVKLY